MHTDSDTLSPPEGGSASGTGEFSRGGKCTVRKAFTIVLASGRIISLRAIEQQITYLGLLDGTPTTEGNARLIASVHREATERWGNVYVIAPVERSIEHALDVIPDAALLPDVCVVAYFVSDEPVHTGDRSSLALLWYQDDWALPIAEDILAPIRDLDWDNHAVDEQLY